MAIQNPPLFPPHAFASSGSSVRHGQARNQSCNATSIPHWLCLQKEPPRVRGLQQQRHCNVVQGYYPPWKLFSFRLGQQPRQYTGEAQECASAPAWCRDRRPHKPGEYDGPTLGLAPRMMSKPSGPGDSISIAMSRCSWWRRKMFIITRIKTAIRH